jgi:type IV secretion system protein TrbJ
MKRINLILVALALVASHPLISRAGLPVIDYSNLWQNTTTALKAVQSYSQQVQQYQTQLQQWRLELLQATGIAPAAQIWQQAQQTMGGVMGTVNLFRSGGALEGYLQNARDVNYWLSTPVNQYTAQPAGYWSLTQKTANEQMVQMLNQQEQEMQKDAAALDALQRQAGSTAGQKAALDAANQLAALEQKQLLEIRALLVSEQQALAARNGTTANHEAMQEAATQQYMNTQLGPQPRTGW